MKIWNVYAYFTADNGYSSWQRITANKMTYNDARSLFYDLRYIYGLELTLNK